MNGRVLPFDLTSEGAKVFESAAQAGRLEGELVGAVRHQPEAGKEIVSALTIQTKDGKRLEGIIARDLKVTIGENVTVTTEPNDVKYIIIQEYRSASRARLRVAKEKLARRTHKRQIADPVQELARDFDRSLKAAGLAAASVKPHVSPQMARGVQATENAWRDMTDAYGMLSSRTVAQMLGSDAKNASDFMADQRAKGKVIGVPRRNAILYPGYQFAHGEVLPVISKLIDVAKEFEVPLPELAQWICIPTRQLGGDRPVDHLEDVGRVVDAAHNHYGVQW